MLDGPTLPLPWDTGSEPERGFVIRRSPRARRLSARVHDNGRAEIIVPARASLRSVEEFVRRYRSWIETRQTRALARRPAPQPFPPQEIHLEALGERWRLHWAGGAGPLRVRVHGAGMLQVTGVAEKPDELAHYLRRFLKRRVSACLPAWLDELARSGGFEYDGLTVRLQRTRWGSCSSRRRISINACIAFQRPEVARYLLCHELAHTRELNHSARYWHIVEGICPGWRELDREMSREGWRRVPSWVLGVAG